MPAPHAKLRRAQPSAVIGTAMVVLLPLVLCAIGVGATTEAAISCVSCAAEGTAGAPISFHACNELPCSLSMRVATTDFGPAPASCLIVTVTVRFLTAGFIEV